MLPRKSFAIRQMILWSSARWTSFDWLPRAVRSVSLPRPSHSCDRQCYADAVLASRYVSSWMLFVPRCLSFPLFKTRLILQRYRGDVRRVEPCFISNSMRTTASVSCALNWECDSALLIIIVPGQRIYRKENPLTSMARLFRHRRLECASSIFSRPRPTGETE